MSYKKTTFIDKWICPRCKSEQTTRRSLKNVGKEILSVCNNCKIASKFLIEKHPDKEDIVGTTKEQLTNEVEEV